MVSISKQENLSRDATHILTFRISRFWQVMISLSLTASRQQNIIRLHEIVGNCVASIMGQIKGLLGFPLFCFPFSKAFVPNLELAGLDGSFKRSIHFIIEPTRL